MLLLPVATRYEQEGGGTETTTERRIIFSPELPAPGRRGPQRVAAVRRRRRAGAARSWPTRSPGPTTSALRAEIAEVVPAYAGIETLATTGDQVQWGGRHLCADGAVPHARRQGAFTAIVPGGARPSRPGAVHGGHPPRQAVQLDGPRRGRPAHRRRPRRRLHRRGRRGRARRGGRAPACASPAPPAPTTGRCKLVRLPTRSLQVHWPEGNVLIASGPGQREPQSKVPDYNAVVTVEVLD